MISIVRTAAKMAAKKIAVSGGTAWLKVITHKNEKKVQAILPALIHSSSLISAVLL
jgi:hypothetical protein